MAETTADVRRDIELTRERMSDTLAQLERKLNVVQVVREHPWPSLALAVGAGVLLANTKADVKSAAAAVKATEGASSKLGSLLDDAASRLITGVSAALSERVDGWVGELKEAIGGDQRQRSVTPAASVAERTATGAYPSGTAQAPLGGSLGSLAH
ncbi:MAG TPA: DUF3618 domain-containing protein [Gemmatimonadaceae bacterium]